MAEYNQNLVTDMQLKWLIKEQHPFHFFDNKDALMSCFRYLQPAYQRVSKNTFKRLAFKYYISAKKDLVKYFETFQGKVSLTLHIWDTAYVDNKYVCVTCHYIDPVSWELSKRTISIWGNLEDNPEIIMDSISAFKIEKDKIFSICFDDGGIFKNCMKMVKEELSPMLLNGVLFETNCVSGVLISMVRSCLDFVDPVIEKFRTLLDYACSWKRDEFVEILVAKRVKFTDPELSFPDIWNTTYKMLRGIVNQKAILIEFYTKCCENDIDDKEWGIVESLLGILEVFHTATVKLSGAKRPTAPLVLEECLSISKMFKKYKEDVFWEPLVREMKSKFVKYYETMSPVYLCAVALNPTIGVMGVQSMLECIAGNLELGDDFAMAGFTKFSEVLQEVFDYYDRMHRSKSGDLVAVSSSSSELDLYKTKDFSKMTSDGNENMEILKWWGTEGRQQYPVLGMMACDILTVQAGVEDSEYAFCLNGRALDEETCESYAWWLQRRIFLKEHFDMSGWEPTADVVEDGLEELEAHGYDKFDGSSDDEE